METAEEHLLQNPPPSHYFQNLHSKVLPRLRWIDCLDFWKVLMNPESLTSKEGCGKEGRQFMFCLIWVFLNGGGFSFEKTEICFLFPKKWKQQLLGLWSFHFFEE